MATPLDRSGSFSPFLQYEYLVPDEWEAVTGASVIVLEHASGSARITLQERTIDRTGLRSISEIADAMEPAGFTDWTERSLSNVQFPGDGTALLSYSGTKLGIPYVATVQWRLWGELLVEVATEASAALWAADSKLRNTALLAATSFAPQGDTPAVSADGVTGELRARFGIRPGNIFADTESGRPGVELSCKQVFHDLLSDPVYVGTGAWQVFAVTAHGVQVWQVFEPALTIVPAEHNTSTC